MIAMILAIGLVKIEVILSIYRLLIIMLKHSKNGIKTYPIKDKIWWKFLFNMLKLYQTF